MPPLPLPAYSGHGARSRQLAASPAVALFVDRARAVRPGFALTEGNAEAVARICRRLEGLPLAIELAAARTRLLDPDALLRRLEASLDALGTGAVDLPERQRTLRATVEWSVGLLDDAERSLLETMAVFVGRLDHRGRGPGGRPGRGPGAGPVRGTGPAQPDLRSTHRAPARGPGCWKPSATSSPSGWPPGPDAAEIGRRHAGYYRALAEQADRPLRGAGQTSGWNACRPKQATSPPPCAGTWPTTPRRCRICSGSLTLLVSLRDHLPEARGLGRSAPARRRLAGPTGPRRADVDRDGAAGDMGDDAGGAGGPPGPGAAAEAIRDPFLRAVSSWPWRGPRRSPATSTAPCGRRRRAWRSSAARTSPSGRRWPRHLGAVEMASGRYDDALGHLCEAHDLAEASAVPGWPPGPGCCWAPRRRPGPAGRGPGPLDEALEHEPGGPHHPLRGPGPGRVRPAGVR